MQAIERAELWAAFMAAFCASNDTTADAAKNADAALKEFDQRFTRVQGDNDTSWWIER